MMEKTDPNTIADRLLTSMGSLTCPIICNNVEEVAYASHPVSLAAFSFPPSLLVLVARISSLSVLLSCCSPVR